MNLYVSNLAYTVTDTDLRVAFEAFGAVTSARVILDRESGRSRGFGFVEMPENHEGQAAIDGLNGKEIADRPIRIVEARPREERPAGGNGGPPRRQFSGGGAGRSGGSREERGGGGWEERGGGRWEERGGRGSGGGRSGGGGRDRDYRGGGGRRRGGNDFADEGGGDW